MQSVCMKSDYFLEVLLCFFYWKLFLMDLHYPFTVSLQLMIIESGFSHSHFVLIIEISKNV